MSSCDELKLDLPHVTHFTHAFHPADNTQNREECDLVLEIARTVLGKMKVPLDCP